MSLVELLCRMPREIRSLAFSALLVGSLSALACRSPNFLADLHEARQATAELGLDFSRADDASNRAVMADTDELSISSARDAQAALARVDEHVTKLEELLQRLKYPEELQAFRDFSRRLTDYRKLDEEILALAVENTNLKAQRLAFGAAREAADEFRASLEGLAATVGASDACRAHDVVAKGVIAVREIQVRMPPHIAESDDQSMTRLEKEMEARRLAARAALDELSTLVDPKSPGFVRATTALERFEKSHTEIIQLSRRNTNVRSLDLALRKKPPLTAACEGSLRTLRAALSKEGTKATR